jgi:porphobilinogen synthase
VTFPVSRPRRLRTSQAMRELVAETRLHVSDLVAPLFVREGISEPQPILSLPGVVQHTVASLVDEVQGLRDLGVKAVILFGVPASKDEIGSGAFDPKGIAQVALRALREAVGDNMVIMADLCVDEYTSHGHCGIVGADGDVDNDATIEIYCKAAIAQATAGAHVVAPSGMMDGQVGAIRSKHLMMQVSRTLPSWRIRRSTHQRCTDLSVMLLTCRLLVADIARATNKIGAMLASRCVKCSKTSNKVQTLSW